MSKLEELKKQQASIALAIAEETAKSRDAALANVRASIKEFEITMSEVKSVLKKRKTRSTAAKKVASTTTSGKRRGRPPMKKAAD